MARLEHNSRGSRKEAAAVREEIIIEQKSKINLRKERDWFFFETEDKD